MKSVDIDGVTISVENTDRYSTDNRSIFEWTIQIEGETYSAADLKSGCWFAPTEAEMLEALLSFLGAAAESYRYDGMEGENSHLFDEPVVKWASEHEDGIGYEQSKLQDELDKECEERTYAETARQTAYDWHGGQDSALYAFASSGMVKSKGALIAEIQRCFSVGNNEDKKLLAELLEFVDNLGAAEFDKTFKAWLAPWSKEWNGE